MCKLFDRVARTFKRKQPEMGTGNKDFTVIMLFIQYRYNIYPPSYLKTSVPVMSKNSGRKVLENVYRNFGMFSEAFWYYYWTHVSIEVYSLNLSQPFYWGSKLCAGSKLCVFLRSKNRTKTVNKRYHHYILAHISHFITLKLKWIMKTS